MLGIWRLMVSTILVSGNGNVALSMDHTDWPSQQVCEQTRQTVYGSSQDSFVVAGLEVKLRVKSFCMPVDDPREAPREGPALPPPLARMMPPWLQR